MMRKIGFAVVSLLLAGVLIAFAGQGAETTVLPLEGKYGPVSVPHWEHQDNLGDCNACHDLFPQELGAVGRLKAEKALKKKTVMNNCRDCHKAMAKADKATGPVKCFDCHAAG